MLLDSIIKSIVEKSKGKRELMLRVQFNMAGGAKTTII